MMIDVGHIIGDVRLDQLVARTGASVVYRGTHLGTGNHKAIKLLAHPDQAAARRLQREAHLLEQIDHAGLVPFHACLRTDAGLALITDWIDGISLRDRLRQGPPLSMAQSLALAHDLADGLDHLHSCGIVHRDISPANIMLRPDAPPVLIDLGIGHAIGESTMTNHDLVAGIPRYLAPEMIRGEPATGRSDQYSLAVLVYELLAGESPFPDGQAIATVLHHQVFTEPTPLNEHSPAVPTHVGQALTRALAKSPLDRFDSIAEFSAALRGEGRPTIAPVTRSRVGPARLVAVLVALTALIAVFLAVREPADPNQVLGTTVAASQPSADESDAGLEARPTWPIGTAATLDCNLLQGSDFANGSVPLDYFGDPPGRERVIAQGGYGDSWALEVGVANDFSLYSETVPVVPGQDYVFAGWFRHDGTIADAEMGISLLDAAYAPLDGEVSVDVDNPDGHFLQVRFADLPSSAAFALPYLFKDASPGVLIADELVFGLDADCGPDLERTEPS